jgi:hypothetical protein
MRRGDVKERSKTLSGVPVILYGKTIQFDSIETGQEIPSGAAGKVKKGRSTDRPRHVFGSSGDNHYADNQPPAEKQEF